MKENDCLKSTLLDVDVLVPKGARTNAAARLLLMSGYEYTMWEIGKSIARITSLEGYPEEGKVISWFLVGSAAVIPLPIAFDAVYDLVRGTRFGLVKKLHSRFSATRSGSHFS